MGNARIHVASDQGSHMSRVKERRGDGLPSERKTLLDAFVEKRRQIALKRDVPAYEIMSDRDIEKLVAAMPSTHEELVNVAGIGPGAVAIGAELAEIVSDHLASVSRDAAGHVIDLFG
jgi:ribonuclease D